MMRRTWWRFVAPAVLVAARHIALAAATPDEPAAVVVYPYVTVDTANRTDTLIQLTNTDAANPVSLRCFYEDFTPKCVGGQPGDRCLPAATTCTGTCREHDFPDCIGGQPGEDCTFCSGACIAPPQRIPFRIRLTPLQPLAWNASSGLEHLPLDANQGGVVPGVGGDPFVGTLHCVAVTDDPNQAAASNVLIGQATVEHSVGTPFDQLAYSDAAAYRAIGIQALSTVPDGDEFLQLGGPAAEYDTCPGVVKLEHFVDGVTVGAGSSGAQVSTTIVVANCTTTAVGVTDTVGEFLVYNEFGQRLSASRSVHGQLVTPLSMIDTPQSQNSIFFYGVLGTLTAQTTIRGQGPSGAEGGVHVIAIESHRDLSVPEHVQTEAFVAHGAGAHPLTDVIAFRLPRCPGDCNDDGSVTVDELVLGVNIALESAPVTACPAMDGDGDATVTVNELVAGVHAALAGCPPAVTPVIPIGTPIPTPTVLPLQSAGPQVTHFGLATADDRPLSPDAIDAQGRPVFQRPFGQGMTLVIEARSGLSGQAPGHATYLESGDLPDLQVVVSRALGDGNPAVCEQKGRSGGIPAVPALDFTADPATVAAINDLGCRAFGGIGQPSPCTRAPTGLFAMVNPASTFQFCIPIAKAWAFPGGDTVVATRVRDVAGNLGPAREIVVRVAE